MKKFINLYTILGVVFLFLFILLMILLNFDKSIISISGKEVGLSSINNLVTYKENENIDLITDIVMYLSFTVAIFEACLGLSQLVKRKSLFKVDKEILIFGISLIVLVALWLAFAYIIKINYRPLDNSELSFPSTHVLVVTFLGLASYFFINLKYNSALPKYISLFVAIVLISFVTIGRVAAGKHYITDSCGGLFLGLGLYFITFGIVNSLIINKEE